MERNTQGRRRPGLTFNHGETGHAQEMVHGSELRPSDSF